MDSSQFFGTDAPTADPQAYDHYGRYLLDADGKGKQAYTRATTLAKTLEDTTGLAIWQQRKAAKGVAQSPALVARAAVTPLDDKATWREILAQAEVKSGGDEKRDLGSAFHALHEHVETMSDAEWDAVPEELRVTYLKYRAELERLGIEEVMTECTVVNTKIGTAGKFDAIFRLADGRLVIGDRKTGRVTEYPHSPAVQLAIYANADVLIQFNDDGSVTQLPVPELDLTMAIVIDITIGDENTASVHAYEVDIWSGWAATMLACQVRRWRNRRDLVTPYHPQFPPTDRARNAAAVIKQDYRGGPVETNTITEPPRATPEQRASFAAELGYGTTPGVAAPVEVAHGPTANQPGMSATTKAVLGTGPAIGTSGIPAATHPAFSSAEQKVIQLDSKGERVTAPTTPQEARAKAAGDFTTADTGDVMALLDAFKTKAQMQEVGRRVGLTNLSRTRANLAKDAVAHPAWPSLRAAILPGVVEPQPYPHVGEDPEPEEFSPVVTNAPGPVPPDPEPTYTPIVTVSPPPQHPADNPFLGPPAPALTTTEDSLLLAIGQAATMDDLAQVWQDAKDHGIGWPPRLHKAAELRQKQLTAQQ